VRRVLSASAIGLLVALVALFVWQLASKDDNAFRDALRSGQSPQAPVFDLPRLDKPGTISTQSLAGHPAVLNFWASWCPPCADEAPDLNALSLRYTGLGVRFVGVDFNDAVDEARAFAKRHDVTYSLVHDTRGVRQAFGVTLGDPLLYDMVLNTGRVSIEGCIEQVIALSRRPEFQPGEASIAHLRNLALQAHIQTALRSHAPDAQISINPEVDGGMVVLRGVVLNERERTRAADIARKVPGVHSVDDQLRVMNASRRYPAPRE